MRGKRGDITVTILVVGIFAICGFATLTFFLASLETADDFIGVSLMEKINLRYEKGESIDGSDNVGGYLEEKEEELIKGDNFVDKVVNGWIGRETNVVFSVKYYK